MLRRWHNWSKWSFLRITLLVHQEDRLGTKIAGNIAMSEVSWTPAVSLALEWLEWGGCDWVKSLTFEHHLHSSCVKHLANRLSTWCYPDLVLDPLNDEAAASPAFYSLNMFHKTECPSISLRRYLFSCIKIWRLYEGSFLIC